VRVAQAVASRHPRAGGGVAADDWRSAERRIERGIRPQYETITSAVTRSVNGSGAFH
jgi:hypothetical protein